VRWRDRENENREKDFEEKKCMQILNYTQLIYKSFVSNVKEGKLERPSRWGIRRIFE
jgi:hypothetical protein